VSFLFGTKSIPAYDQKALGLNTINTATNEQGNPLPYLAGQRRFAGTFITDAFDQRATSASGGKDSGKGGGGSGYNYYCGFAIAFCLGPVDVFSDLWLNGEPVYTSNTPLSPVSLKETNNVATFQTANAHGLASGQSVVVTGADQPEFNGEYVVTVISATQFQYTIPGTTLTTESASGQIHAWIKLAPIYRGAEDYVDITIPNYGILRLFWGTETQPADHYLQVSGTNHPPYRGVCYGVFYKIWLGLNQTNIQNVEVALARCPTAPWLTNAAHANISNEANAAVIYYELLTHPRAGLGLTAADFDTAALAAVADTLYAENFGVSPIITRIDSALALVQQLLQTVDALPVLDDNGLLSLVLIRPNINVKTGLVDYTDLTELADANLADIPQPVNEDWSNTFNQTRLVFPNQDAEWNSDFVEWQDFSAIQSAQNAAQPQTTNLDFLTRRDLALALVQAQGSAAAVPTRTGKMSLLFDPVFWSEMSPGNLFINNFTDPTCARSNGVFRVTRRTFQASATPVFEVEFAADKSYLNLTLSAATTPAAHAHAIDQGQASLVIVDPIVPPLDPIPTTASVIIELPVLLCPNNKPAIAALIARDQVSTFTASLYLGRNFVFNGVPPESYSLLAKFSIFALTGALTADFLASTGFVAITNQLPAQATDNPFPLCAGLAVQLTGPDLILPDVCDFDALANTILLFCGSEIMSIAEATLTAASAYTLTVIRGRFGTAIVDHHAGDAIWVIAKADLDPLQHPHFLGGNTAEFKLTLGTQTTVDVNAFNITFAGTNWPFSKDASSTQTVDSQFSSEPSADQQ
jgi:hypothetical protein